MKDHEAEKTRVPGSKSVQLSTGSGVGPQADVRRADDTLSAVTCKVGDASCSRAHASTLQRSTGSRLERRPQSLLQLQREYGNRYVQRVLDVARREAGESEVTSEVEKTLQSERGGGQALDSGVRGQMEPAFDTDFSGVRVHADSKADSLSRSLSARAFTTGSDIFFREGAYRPGTSSGRELLAHELTHVVQQGGRGGVRRKLTMGRPGDAYEQEADRVAKEVMQRQVDTEPRSLDRQAEEEESESS